jgi:hypothetical protein
MNLQLSGPFRFVLVASFFIFLILLAMYSAFSIAIDNPNDNEQSLIEGLGWGYRFMLGEFVGLGVGRTVA